MMNRSKLLVEIRIHPGPMMSNELLIIRTNIKNVERTGENKYSTKDIQRVK